LPARAGDEPAKRKTGRARFIQGKTAALLASGSPFVLEIDEALDRLAEVDERKAKVIEMRYFGGMDREEVASALGITVPTVKLDLQLGEAWLRRFLAGDSPKGQAI
jgi:DNA-directed RNA polymerase specialized sigma24 family protein